MTHVVHLEHPTRYTKLVGIRVPDAYCGRRGGTVQTRPWTQRDQVTCARCRRSIQATNLYTPTAATATKSS